jgi:hypothetical protein
VSNILSDRKTISPLTPQRQAPKTLQNIPAPISPKKNQVVTQVISRTSIDVDMHHSKLPVKIELLLTVLACCEVFHSSSALLRLYLLTLKHLQHLLKCFEQEMRTMSISLSENSRNILNGVSRKVMDLSASANPDRVSGDLYFTYILT